MLHHALNRNEATEWVCLVRCVSIKQERRRVALGYGTALWLMTSSTDMLPIGVVYALWAGVSMVGAALGVAILASAQVHH